MGTLDVISRTGIGKKTMMTPGAETEIYTITRRWIECGWQKGQSEVVDELHAPNFVDNNPAGRGSDNDGFKEGIVQLYAAFPDFHARINPVELLEQLPSRKRRSQRRADSKTSRRPGSSQSDSASSRKVNPPRILINGEGASVSLGGGETPPDIIFAK